MLRVKVEKVRDGLHPSEIVVAVHTADNGRALLVVDRRSLRGDSTLLIGYPVGEDKDNSLVELPRETMSGSWRVWVPSTALVPEDVAA